MNRAYLVVGIPGIVVATAYIGVGYGWRAGIIAACIGAALIAVAAWFIRSNASTPR
jgi:glucose-6-phosphate-specific signal transduction histidine kinase